MGESLIGVICLPKQLLSLARGSVFSGGFRFQIRSITSLVYLNDRIKSTCPKYKIIRKPVAFFGTERKRGTTWTTLHKFVVSTLSWTLTEPMAVMPHMIHKTAWCMVLVVLPSTCKGKMIMSSAESKRFVIHSRCKAIAQKLFRIAGTENKGTMRNLRCKLG